MLHLDAHALPSESEKPKQARQRVSRLCYVANPTPAFAIPDHHKKGRPRFLKKAFNFCRVRDVTTHPAWALHKERTGRKRHIYLHRRRSINTVSQGMIHFVNRITWQVETSIDVITRMCGLDTTSRAGNHSVTRGTRALMELETLGAVICDKRWDPLAGCYIFKSIVVTELFWEIIGIPAEEAQQDRDDAWTFWHSAEAYVKEGFTPEQLVNLSRAEYVALRRERQVQRAFEHRRKRQATARDVRKARALVALGKDGMRQAVSDMLIKAMDPAAFAFISRNIAAFRSRVTLEVHRLRVLATEPIPPPG